MDFVRSSNFKKFRNAKFPSPEKMCKENVSTNTSNFPHYTHLRRWNTYLPDPPVELGSTSTSNGSFPEPGVDTERFGLPLAFVPNCPAQWFSRTHDNCTDNGLYREGCTLFADECQVSANHAMCVITLNLSIIFLIDFAMRELGSHDDFVPFVKQELWVRGSFNAVSAYSEYVVRQS